MRLSTHRAILLAIALAFNGPAIAQVCDHEAEIPRSAAVTKPTAWKLSGAYDLNNLAPSAIAMDVTGDGRNELLGSGVASIWQALGYIPETGAFEIVHTARSPFRQEYPDQVHAAALARGSLERGATSKIVSTGNFSIHDAETLDLEVIAEGIGIGLLSWMLDVDQDGHNDIITSSGSVMASDLTRFLSGSSNLDGVAAGNFDLDPNIEMQTSSGAMYEWNNGDWVHQTAFSIGSGRAPFFANGDVDADGKDELVSVLGGNVIHVYDLVEDRELWTHEVVTLPLPHHPSAKNNVDGLSVADVNDDGRGDVLVTTEGSPAYPGEVQAFRGDNGQMLWSFSHPDIYSSPATIADIDDDPGKEVIFLTGRPVTGPDRLRVHDLDTLEEQWVQRQEAGLVRAMAFGNLDGQPGDEIVVAPRFVISEADARIHIRSLASMSYLDEWPSANLPGPGFLGIGALQIADVMGDSAQELIVGSGAAPDTGFEGRVYVYSLPDRSLLRSFTLPESNLVVGLVAADMDNNGSNEIVVAAGLGDTPYLYVLDAQSGAIEWKSELDFHYVDDVNALVVRDLDGDQIPEIIATGLDITIVDGKTREQHRRGSGPFFGVTVGDVDGDEILDVIAGRGEEPAEGGAGRILVFRGPAWDEVIDHKVCDSDINALAWNEIDPTARQVFFSCGSQLGMMDFPGRCPRR